MNIAHFIGLILLIVLILLILTPLFDEKQKPKSAGQKLEEAIKQYLNELGEKK